MKKLIVLLLVAISTTAFAQHRYNHQRQYHPTYGWVVPAIIGGVLVYEISKAQQPPPPPPVIVQQPPVVMQQPPVVMQQPPVVLPREVQCTGWKEIQLNDGNIVRERYCY